MFSIKKSNGRTCCKLKSFVNNIICRLGCPLELNTDQGNNMDGYIIHQICELLQKAKTRTTPYHPAPNGQVERYNRTILQALRCYIKNKQDTTEIVNGN